MENGKYPILVTSYDMHSRYPVYLNKVLQPQVDDEFVLYTILHFGSELLRN